MNAVQKIEKQIEALEAKKKVLQGKTLVECKKCKKKTQVHRLTYIQTYWYEEPYGCMGGDNWNQGEGRFKCPKCDRINRLFKQDSEVKKLKYFFKEIIDFYEE